MIIVSHRGPASFTREPDGSFAVQRGAGGVVSALAPLLTGGAEGDVTWIAAAMTDDDRAAAQLGMASLDSVHVRLVDFDAHQHHLHYNIVSNATLWFLHHGLFDLPRRPRFDRRFREAWDAYVAVNQGFSDAVTEAADEDDIVLVQDYQLALVPGQLRARRPDLRVVHFTHTPFCGPNSIRVLPDDIGRAMCGSMASVPCGFHTRRWASSYEASARTVLGAGPSIHPVFASSLGPDPDDLHAVAQSSEGRDATAALDEQLQERKLLLRIDRIEPAKNIVRGFLAFDLLLQDHPEWKDRVVFVAMLNASREGLADYQAYRLEVEQAAARVNERWARGDWQPVVVDTRDDFPRAVAGYRRYAALLVNSLKDGLNLVAKEGPILNERDGVVCLSPEAGAYDELHSAVTAVHPYDLGQTAGALHDALSMPDPERRERARRLRELAAARTPEHWFNDLLAAAEHTR